MRASKRIAELELRVEGLELLLADLLGSQQPRGAPLLAPEAAQLVAEERYGSLPPKPKEAAHPGSSESKGPSN